MFLCAELLKAVESRGGADVAIQVTQWMRAAYASKYPPDGDIDDALAKEAEKELKAKEYVDTVGLGLPSIPESSSS